MKTTYLYVTPEQAALLVTLVGQAARLQGVIGHLQTKDSTGPDGRRVYFEVRGKRSASGPIRHRTVYGRHLAEGSEDGARLEVQMAGRRYKVVG